MQYVTVRCKEVHLKCFNRSTIKPYISRRLNQCHSKIVLNEDNMAISNDTEVVNVAEDIVLVKIIFLTPKIILV